MEQKLNVATSIQINAGADKVWKTLTTPSLIKEYLMGADVHTDWKQGSPIGYTGEYNGKPYTDKGVILKIESGKILQSTYLSSASGKEDKPENYNIVTYELSAEGNGTRLSLHQTNVSSEKEKEHLTENWNHVLGKLKEIAERQ